MVIETGEEISELLSQWATCKEPSTILIVLLNALNLHAVRICLVDINLFFDDREFFHVHEGSFRHVVSKCVDRCELRNAKVTIPKNFLRIETFIIKEIFAIMSKALHPVLVAFLVRMRFELVFRGHTEVFPKKFNVELATLSAKVLLYVGRFGTIALRMKEVVAVIKHRFGGADINRMALPITQRNSGEHRIELSWADFCCFFQSIGPCVRRYSLLVNSPLGSVHKNSWLSGIELSAFDLVLGPESSRRNVRIPSIPTEVLVSLESNQCSDRAHHSIGYTDVSLNLDSGNNRGRDHTVGGDGRDQVHD